MSDYTVASVFSNHMVLQRNQNITIFGYGKDKTKIFVELFDSKNNSLSKNSTTISNGYWKVQLLPQIQMENCTLKVNETIFTDVSIGEVWLAGGQSNMEFELQNCTEGPFELENEKSPNVRFYYTNKIAWKDDDFYKAEKNTCWQTWDSEWKKAWSAVGYFFAKKLAKDLNCTVGIIGCNWGGTSASAWMRKEFLEKDEDLKTYLTEQEEATKGKSIEQQCKEYDDYTKENDEWQKKCNHLYETIPNITWAEVQEKIGPCKWPGPKSCKNPYRPTGLYDCMLSRILPYTIKGIIWYQGESDDHKPKMYYKLFSSMIDNWRTDWSDNNLPFIFVQLPEHRYEYDKDFKNWCLIREAQEKIHQTIKNAWMTVALDLGQFNDIHPKAKKVLGCRMENIALSKVYNKIDEKEVCSPTLKDYFIAEDSIILSFSNAENGFEHHDDKKELEELKIMEEKQGNIFPSDFSEFEIAGEDGIFYPAEVKFSKEKLNQIILTSKKVSSPKYARYAWYNYGPVTIFGKNGLPLAPFRTNKNDENQTTEHANIQQIMTV